MTKKIQVVVDRQHFCSPQCFEAYYKINPVMKTAYKVVK